MGRPFTPKEDRFLKRNYMRIPAKRMSVMLGHSEGTARQRMKVLGLIVPPEIIELFRKQSQFIKGHVSFNKGKKQSEYMSKSAIAKTKKTRFRKGNLPYNTLEDLAITIRHDNRGVKYKFIRTSLGKWVALHTYNWEQVHGKLPKGHCLWFIDDNSLNPDVSNLELITRAENMRRNSYHTNYPAEIGQLIQLRGALNRQINKKIKISKNEK